MLGTHCIVKFYIGQIYHCTEEKTDNVLIYYGIAITALLERMAVKIIP